MDSKALCETCVYWNFLRIKDGVEFGECRESSPGVVGRCSTIWPETRGGLDWCGKWALDMRRVEAVQLRRRKP